MSTQLCQSYECENTSSIVCNVCNIVKYCSEECMREDLPGHSIICREDYSQMLRAYSRHLRSKKKLIFMSLSYPLRTKLDGKRYIMGLNKEFFCICCRRLGLNDHDGINFGNGANIENNVYYGRCEECYSSDVKLCANSYLDANLCWRGIKGLMLLQEYILRSSDSDNCIPYEIFGYIVGVIVNAVDSNGNKIACIEHMFE